MTSKRRTRMAYQSAVCAMALGLGVAIGGSPADAVVYATQIESDQVASPGWDASTPATPPATEDFGDVRTDPSYALGAEDGYFFSLGLGGIAVFDFSTLFLDPATVFEVTFGCGIVSPCTSHPEGANVYGLQSFDPDPDGAISLAGADDLGTVFNSDSLGGSSVSFLGSYAYLVLEDISATLSDISEDGFDVDAVSVKPIPLPAGLVLFLSGLAGVGFLGRYKAKKRASAVA